MSSLNVEQLLEPVSFDQPCGENLEYDADFGELERAALPKPEQEYGKTKIEAQEPDWRDVRNRAVELFGRTKDLRVATYLARAALRIEGLDGFRDVLAVVRGLIEKYWAEVHPQLDPEDDLDPALRVNTLATLCDKEVCLLPLLEAAVVQSPLGKTCFRDYLIALGEQPPRSGQEPVEMSTIEAAFTSADGDSVLATQAIARGAAEDSAGIEAAVTEQVGMDRTVSLDPLTDVLRRIAKLVDEHVERLGLGKTVEETATDDLLESLSGLADFSTDAGLGDTEAVTEAGGYEEAAAVSAAAAPKAPAFDHVGSRDDVIRLLDKLCDYYREYEPSSPVPLLLRRAKRIATMDFMELLRELAPGGLAEVELLKGSNDGDTSS
jgi:type VI secretion system protein ImpA